MNKPNLLFIMSDQHTPGVTGCYGNSVVHTPNLDRLAAEGVQFDAAYCASPLCVPSRLAMLSGRHPHNLGVWCLGDTMRSDTPTWPVPLSVAGWRTVLCGRMHLVWADRNHGFEERLCGDEFTSMQNQFGHWRETEVYNARSGHGVSDAHVGTGPHDAEDENTESKALEFIRGYKSSTDKRPFALCVGFYRPHAPFVAPQELASLYADFQPPVGETTANLPPFYKSIAAHFDLVNWAPSDDDARRAIRHYYAMVTGIDQRIGRLVTALRDEGILDNTIIVYTSDHGESLGRHGMWFKSTFYEESVRVPLIVRYPMGFQHGLRVSSPVSLLDLFPTFCEVAGVTPYEFLDGKSLMPALTSTQTAADRPVYAEYSAYGLHEPTRMVRRGKYKMMFARGYTPVLFDLEADPREEKNLADDPAHKGIGQELLSLLQSDWDADTVRKRVLANQRNRDLFVDAEKAIHLVTGDKTWPWRGKSPDKPV